MADKKYQIFVSSTYTDLIEERSLLLKAILKQNCIPAGMEFFTAIDEKTMKFIQQVIDESDYYVLLLGARYGSIDKKTGVSFTEQEYDYAVKKGKKVIALIRENLDEVPQGKVDKNPEIYKKFMAFRDKVINPDEGRLVAFWNNTTELIDNFHSSLGNTIKQYPAKGWERNSPVVSQAPQQNNNVSEEQELSNQNKDDEHISVKQESIRNKDNGNKVFYKIICKILSIFLIYGMLQFLSYITDKIPNACIVFVEMLIVILVIIGTVILFLLLAVDLFPLLIKTFVNIYKYYLDLLR